MRERVALTTGRSLPVTARMRRCVIARRHCLRLAATVHLVAAGHESAVSPMILISSDQGS